MRIIEILPELVEGGVERHIIDLTRCLSDMGHEVMVASAGGKLVSRLDSRVKHWELPVEKKNPLTAWSCAARIADRAISEGWQILHAHSRVPAWIAMWAAKRAGVPYAVTAHVNFGNKSRWIYAPYRSAGRVLCVSNAVRDGMRSCFGDNAIVVHNGMPEIPFKWQGPDDGSLRLLFIGRLSKVKGIQDIVDVLPDVPGDWTLDILGDGPLMEHLRSRIEELGMKNRIVLHGFSDRTDEYLRRCSCLLFPSYQEGMPLTLARAIQMEVPCIAADIPPVEEMSLSSEGLLEPGNLAEWRKAIRDFARTGSIRARFNRAMIPTVAEMTAKDEAVYRGLLEEASGR